MLKAVQAREKETQDKVNKEKAALLKARQKERIGKVMNMKKLFCIVAFCSQPFSDVSPECD